ncbi:MAG: carboxylesterase family protein [Ilumatobacteraceae bacterium]
MTQSAYARRDAGAGMPAGEDDMARRTNPEVEIGQGRLAGRWKAKGTVAVFKGIPFAAPPVGDLRWRPPAPAPSWNGVRDAGKHGATAVQRAAGFETFMHELLGGQGWHPTRVRGLEALMQRMPRPPESEDCLYLTVRSPALDPAAKLPVMVWIHGGDHQDGSGSDIYYDSNVIAGKGVVSVSINYRLGVFGYFAHPDLRAESDHDVAGNYGTLDQIAALEWVRDNIAAFGGDPDNVTIFGRSAGGESVLHMMTSPLARGLFHRAIAQSPANGGQMIHLDRPFLAHPSAEDRSRRFAEAAGATGDAPIAQLRTMSAERLHEIVLADDERSDHYPVIDGASSRVALRRARRWSPGARAVRDREQRRRGHADPAGARRADGGVPLPPPARRRGAARAGRGIRRRPRPTRRDLPGARPSRPSCRDRLRRRPDVRGAGVLLRRPPRPGRVSDAPLSLRPRPKLEGQTVGAYHAAELPFVHGSNVPILPMTAKDKALSREMVTYWTDHARRADVNAPAPGVNHPEWPAFDPDDPQWICFDHTVTVEPVQRRDQYAIFTSLIDRRAAAMTP